MSSFYELQAGCPEAAHLAWGCVVIVWLFGMLFYWRKQMARRYSTLEQLSTSRSYGKEYVRICALLVAWLASMLALMQLRGNFYYTPASLAQQQKSSPAILRLPAQQLIFMIDASASMLVHDTRLGTSRFSYAKQITDDIIRHLPAGISLSVSAFTSEVTVLSPATNDYFFVRMALEQMEINEGESSGTAFAPVISWMQKQLREQHFPWWTTFVLISDGGDNGWEKLSGRQRKEYLEKLAAPLAHISHTLSQKVVAQSIEIGSQTGEDSVCVTRPRLSESQSQSTECANFPKECEKCGLVAMPRAQLISIGMGSLSGGKIPGIIFEGRSVHSALEEELMRYLAMQTKGEYLAERALSSSAIAERVIEAVYRQRALAMKAKAQEYMTLAPASEPLFDEYFQLPLALALFALVVALGLPLSRSQLLGVAVACSFFSCNSGEGGSSEDFFKKGLRYSAAEAAIGDFSSSYQHYLGLLGRVDTPDRRALLLYNCSAVQAREKEFAEAVVSMVKAFDMIKGGVGHPLLRQRLYANFSFVRLAQAKQMIQRANGERMRLAEAALLLRSGKRALEAALKVECLRLQAAGEKSCPPSEQLFSIGQQIKALGLLLEESYDSLSDNILPFLSGNEDPLTLAQAILAMQGHVTAAHAIRGEKERGELLAMQRQSVELARKFLPTALEWQKNLYEKAKNSSQHICLRSPWDSVFPAAERGLQATESAQKLLEEGDIDSQERALWRQWEAWEAWRNVYNSLREGKKPEEQQAQEQPAHSSSFEQARSFWEKMLQEEGGSKPQRPLASNSRW